MAHALLLAGLTSFMCTAIPSMQSTYCVRSTVLQAERCLACTTPAQEGISGAAHTQGVCSSQQAGSLLHLECCQTACHPGASGRPHLAQNLVPRRWKQIAPRRTSQQRQRWHPPQTPTSLMLLRPLHGPSGARALTCNHQLEDSTLLVTAQAQPCCHGTRQTSSQCTALHTPIQWLNHCRR